MVDIPTLQKYQKYLQTQINQLQTHNNVDSKDYHNLLKCRQTQLKVVEYFLTERNIQSETVEQQNSIVISFLHSYILGLQSIEFNSLELFLEDVMIESGMLEPFVGPGSKVGVPSQVDDETACDNMMELLRVCGAAVVAVYLYANVQQKHGTFAPDHVASMFLAMSLNTFKKEEVVRLIDVEIEHVSPVSNCASLQWLMKWLQAELSGYVAAVYQMMGDQVLINANRNTRQQSLLHLIKILPDCSRGYTLYCLSCLQNKQFQVALLFGRKGLQVAISNNHKHDEACLLYLLVVSIVSGGEDQNWDVVQVRDMITKADELRSQVFSYLDKDVKELTKINQFNVQIGETIFTKIQTATEGKMAAMQLDIDVDQFTLPLGSMLVYD